MIFVSIILTVFFSVTLFFGARDIPARKKMRCKYIGAAAVLSVCNYFMLYLTLSLSEISAVLSEEVSKNKAEAESVNLWFLSKFVSGVHSVCERISDAASLAAEYINLLVSESAGATPICLISFAFAAVLIILTTKEENIEPIEPDKYIPLSASIFKLIGGEISGKFFLAPLCSFLAAIVLMLIKAPYYPVTAVFLWILSFIPCIGWIIGAVMGAVIYIASGHVLYGILFAAVSAVLFAGGGFLKDYISARFEIKDIREKRENADSE